MYVLAENATSYVDFVALFRVYYICTPLTSHDPSSTYWSHVYGYSSSTIHCLLSTECSWVVMWGCGPIPVLLFPHAGLNDLVPDNLLGIFDENELEVYPCFLFTV